MRLYEKISVLVFLFCSSLTYAQNYAQNQICKPEQYSVGNEEYDKLISKGSTLLKSHKPRLATAVWEKAMQVKFVDIPNFQLYSCLAFAYYKAGETQLALSTLKKSELSLKLLVGEVKCTETIAGFSLIEDNQSLKVDSNTEEIKARMCGAAYDYFYSNKSFKSVLHDAELLSDYLNIKDIINLHSPQK
jgi:hypothetical protein